MIAQTKEDEAKALKLKIAVDKYNDWIGDISPEEEIKFPKVLSLRFSQEDLDEIDKIVKLNRDRFESRTQFCRSAIIQKMRKERKLLNK